MCGSKKRIKRKRRRAGRKHRQFPVLPTTNEEINNIEVGNLSAKTLSDDQITLLSKGLTFSPTTHFSLFQTLLDVNKFVRNIRKHFSIDNINAPGEVNNADVTDIHVMDEINLDEPVYIIQSQMNFQDLINLSHLRALKAKSVRPLSNQISIGFITSNPYFYPVQTRT